MIPNYLAKANQMEDTLSELREAFHSRPELGNQEFQTAARIESVLQECGVEVNRILPTAVVDRKSVV